MIGWTRNLCVLLHFGIVTTICNFPYVTFVKKILKGILDILDTHAHARTHTHNTSTHYIVELLKRNIFFLQHLTHVKVIFLTAVHFWNRDETHVLSNPPRRLKIGHVGKPRRMVTLRLYNTRLYILHISILSIYARPSTAHLLTFEKFSIYLEVQFRYLCNS